MSGNTVRIVVQNLQRLILIKNE